ncbi:MAG: Asp-tRNA(Asn)/Glu-tRNA(Gln) amidotransferase GatCAB subunit C, partial [Alphaproteobacteria bacterium]|nr:Asp-tRNA(Asn)/Glu-tRNA(Gln) amidotransferase GatCAB subunit C [Alphaproteobacteria bacterium]
MDSYSLGAGQVVMPHVVGDHRGLVSGHTTWPSIAEAGELVAMFGGMPLKNGQVNASGMGRHTVREGLEACRRAGVKFVNISPARDDAADFLDAEWLPLRPSTDTALMLGLAHTLVADGLHDQAFLDRYTTGFDRFRPYLMGESDGVPKNAAWAAAITGLSADAIRDLARRMARHRTMVTTSWSIQRVHHGEQAFWMAIVLAAMLGQIGLPGGGFGLGYSAVNNSGNHALEFPWPALPQGHNPVEDFIPVARIADMLLNPGQPFDYNGERRLYPDIKLVYWAGGNPFHHHQDLNRFIHAWRRPEVVIAHEPWWNPLARHADIVFPATTSMERNDIACATGDSFMVAMKKAVEPVGQARHDYDICAGLAERLGCREAFTEGRTEADWLHHFYAIARQRAAERGIDMPDFDAFWRSGVFELPALDKPRVLHADFRADPARYKLKTPSGRIEIFSETIAGFGYDDCPGHPTWMEPVEWLGAAQAKKFPLHLVSNQPYTRLHSQYDLGAYSLESKIKGREPARLNPEDAAARGIKTGDIIRVFNDRGACLAGVIVSDAIERSCIQLSTGAWYDPVEPGQAGALEAHGNPNVLTIDKGSSKLAQGTIAHSCLVEVERYDGALPPVRAFDPPAIMGEGGRGD